MVGLCIGDPLEAVGIHTFGRLKRGEKGWFNAPASHGMSTGRIQPNDVTGCVRQHGRLNWMGQNHMELLGSLALLVLSDVTKTQTNTSSITSQRKTPPPRTAVHAGTCWQVTPSFKLETMPPT